MNSYLKYASNVYQNVVKDPGFYGKLRVVLGNESCDLDSAVCSLVVGYALFKEVTQNNCGENIGVLSLLNIPHGDLPLKTEVTYFLNKNGIQMEYVQTRGCRDLLDLHKIYEAGALELILVDHHTLPICDEDLQAAVTEIIDHRPRDPRWQWENVRDVDIRTVGSCSTLVAEKILNRYPHLMTEELAKLLIGPIVIDTMNLSPDAGRATELDREIVQSLERRITLDRTEVLNELVRAKSSVDSLSTLQIFRKDLKVIAGIPMPGSPVLIENLIKRDNFEEDVIHFMRMRNVPVMVLLGLQIDGANVARDLAICSKSDKIISLLLEALMDLKEPELQLEMVECNGMKFSFMRLYRQLNIKATRKHIAPVIQRVVENIDDISSCGFN